MHWYEFPPPTPGCILCTGAFDHVKNVNDYIDNICIENNLNKSCMYTMGTEACTGFAPLFSPPKKGPSIGNWDRGVTYSEDIIGDLNNGASGWVDWNMVLDISGGPNHANNSCDAPVIIDFQNGIYYKQPLFYLPSHVTRYIRPGYIRIETSTGTINTYDHLWILGALSDDLNRTIVVILNSDKQNDYMITLSDIRFGYATAHIPRMSIQTFFYDN